MDVCRRCRRFELMHDGGVGATVHKKLRLRKEEKKMARKKDTTEENEREYRDRRRERMR